MERQGRGVLLSVWGGWRAAARSMQGGWRCCARPIYAGRLAMLCAPCLCREDGDAAPAMRNCSESLRDFVQEEGDASRARSMQGSWQCCARPVYAERLVMLRLP